MTERGYRRGKRRGLERGQRTEGDEREDGMVGKMQSCL